MVSFSDLRDADPSAYDDIADQWARLAGELDATARDIKRAAGGLDGWSGEAADMAREHIADVRSGYDTAAEYIDRIPGVLRTLSDAISDAQERVNRAVDTAEARDMVHVDRVTGAVSTPPGVAPGDMRTDEQLAADRELVTELNDAITAAVADATEADRVASRQLDDLMPDDAGLSSEAVGSGNIVTPSELPQDDWSAAEVKEWWDELTPMQQESAIYTHGDSIGTMDGIPVEARDRANRIRFADEYADLEARRDALIALGDDRSLTQDNELRELNDVHEGMDAIKERLEREPTGNAPQAYLLDFETEGNGRGIVATGNPDTADNTVTNVPGTGSGLSSMPGELSKADRILEAAGQYSSAETAAVTWIGYDAPQDVLFEAPRESYADEAAPDLAGFQNGLDATHEGGGGHNTVIGHSYGSTVVGHTARDHGLTVDNMVFLGSPGVGVDHAGELNIDPENVYASTAENDIIRAGAAVSHGLGDSPIDEDFGAVEFRSDPGTDGLGPLGSTDAHSEYWDRQNESLKNLGRIVTGQDNSTLTTPTE
ncbi:alpha/beta hydrolase [Haloechinothrix sp. YIM 98757]|uniref:Alpha/beta hydrolase n=1 Tax=Haloechinothrix aidingensis TaxID=2752311 RepID=A0A838A8N6_9PSEU|nr:alpha/beta hydrolase [Haloechinothrix aidingensis]MBA0125147.1 alpha/beta hydrolase [Haloechinothrix aidingensis]